MYAKSCLQIKPEILFKWNALNSFHESLSRSTVCFSRLFLQLLISPEKAVPGYNIRRLWSCRCSCPSEGYTFVKASIFPLARNITLLSVHALRREHEGVYYVTLDPGGLPFSLERTWRKEQRWPLIADEQIESWKGEGEGEPNQNN